MNITTPLGVMLLFGLTLATIGCDNSSLPAQTQQQREEKARVANEAKEIERKLAERQKEMGMQMTKELEERNRLFAQREAAK